MENIKVLDCTLRDGGYCNQWDFQFHNICKITKGLVEADVDIIECGFLTNTVVYNENISKFTTMEEVAKIIPEERKGKLFVCLMNYGEYDVDTLPDCDGTSLDGIRVAFHKKDAYQALEVCKKIKAKGYKVFIQAMVSLSYTDEDFLKLIHICNEFQPFAFYIVDSFGVMKRKDLMRLFYMVEHNLQESICIGFHSHNNLQLAYSNAQALVDTRTNHTLIIDSSIFGMGRGAGNLNTELFLEYLNDNIAASYNLKPLLVIIDEILNGYYQRNYWGYSLPNYLSARHNAHPNYAGYLDNKKTLTIENIDEIFSLMEKDKKVVFDKKYIENLYLQYMEKGNLQEENLINFQSKLKGKGVLIIAPGKSSVDEQDKILKMAEREDIVTISVNFDYKSYETDFIFLSNIRRFNEINTECYNKMIVTTNVPATDVYLRVKYTNLLNSIDAVCDNATMMLIQLLIHMGTKNIYLAGLDGYSYDIEQNFAESTMNYIAQRAILMAVNEGMNTILAEYAKKVKIDFVTTPQYVKIV